MENSKIEWCHSTLNLWWGCEKVHTGCKNCYAEAWDKRYAGENPHWGPGSSRKGIKSAFKDLDKFQRDAAKEGGYRRVFVGSMMDIFEDPLPMVDHNNIPITGVTTSGEMQVHTGMVRDLFFDLIRRDKFPNLMFLLLTKRPENINKYIPESWLENPPVNVMFGTSVVNQETANKAVVDLLKVKGKHFLSCEPLVGYVDLTNILVADIGIEIRANVLTGKLNEFDGKIEGKIDWLICGGESGHKARPMHPDWARSLRDQCREAGTPFFFKQWGEWHESDLQERPDIAANGRHLWPGGKLMYKVGKHEAGNLLDGVEHKYFNSYE